MSHNYRLTDFKITKDVNDIDLNEKVISVDLSDVKKIPSGIVPRLERMINEMIGEYEEKKAINIPLDSMELFMYVTANCFNDLVVEIYIGLWCGEMDTIEKKESIGVSDEDYTVIKQYFVGELWNDTYEKLKKIEEGL